MHQRYRVSLNNRERVIVDIVDHAQMAEAMHRESALERHRRTPPVASATHCEVSQCGVRIPEARRRAIPGVTRCVDCQARIERGRLHGEGE